jgi:hypothetical protein
MHATLGFKALSYGKSNSEAHRRDGKQQGLLWEEIDISRYRPTIAWAPKTSIWRVVPTQPWLMRFILDVHQLGNTARGQRVIT